MPLPLPADVSDQVPCGRTPSECSEFPLPTNLATVVGEGSGR